MIFIDRLFLVVVLEFCVNSEANPPDSRLLVVGLAGIPMLPVEAHGQWRLREPLLVVFQSLQFHLGKEFLALLAT